MPPRASIPGVPLKTPHRLPESKRLEPISRKSGGGPPNSTPTTTIEPIRVNFWQIRGWPSKQYNDTQNGSDSSQFLPNPGWTSKQHNDTHNRSDSSPFLENQGWPSNQYNDTQNRSDSNQFLANPGWPSNPCTSFLRVVVFPMY